MKQYQLLLWYGTIQHDIHTKFGKRDITKKNMMIIVKIGNIS